MEHCRGLKMVSVCLQIKLQSSKTLRERFEDLNCPESLNLMDLGLDSHNLK